MFFHLYEIQGQGPLDTALKMMKAAVGRLNMGSSVQLAEPRRFHENSFFVAVGFEKSEHADAAQQVVSSIPGFKECYFKYRALPSSEVGDFLTGNVVSSGPLRIPQVEPDENDDPFNLQMPADSLSEKALEQTSIDFEKLHWFISALGHGSWPTFARLAAQFGLKETYEIKHAFRNLTLLGHVAMGASGKNWTCLPPAIYRRAAKPHRGFLTGQMLPSLYKMFPADAQLRKGKQPNSRGPNRVSLEWSFVAENPDLLTNEGWKICSDYLELIRSLPTLEEWRISLVRFPCTGFASWDAERWVPGNDTWEQAGAVTHETLRRCGDGFYRVKKSGPLALTRDLYADSSTGDLLAGDWYGLRWLAAHSSDPGPNVAWHPDADAAETGTLLIPACRRWPLVYERALVLASGKLPKQESATSRLVYGGVPKSAAELLAAKVKAGLLIVEEPSANV